MGLGLSWYSPCMRQITGKIASIEGWSARRFNYDIIRVLSAGISSRDIYPWCIYLGLSMEFASRGICSSDFVLLLFLSHVLNLPVWQVGRWDNEVLEGLRNWVMTEGKCRGSAADVVRTRRHAVGLPHGGFWCVDGLVCYGICTPLVPVSSEVEAKALDSLCFTFLHFSLFSWCFCLVRCV